MTKKSRRRAGKVVTLDFSDVDTREVIPEDDYLCVVHDIEEDDGPKGTYWTWIFKVKEGEYKGTKLYYITSLAKQSLFSLRAVLEALGEEVPKSKMDVDRTKYIGMDIGVSVEVGKFKKKDKNEVVDVFNPEEEDEGGEEDEGTEEESGEEGGEESTEDEEEYTGTIKEIDDDVLTCDIDGDEVDVYTEDAEVTGEPAVGATVVITGYYDEEEDLIASEVVVKTASKKKSKKKKK